MRCGFAILSVDSVPAPIAPIAPGKSRDGAHCSACGTLNPYGAGYCNRCGRSIAPLLTESDTPKNAYQTPDPVSVGHSADGGQNPDPLAIVAPMFGDGGEVRRSDDAAGSISTPEEPIVDGMVQTIHGVLPQSLEVSGSEHAARDLSVNSPIDRFTLRFLLAVGLFCIVLFIITRASARGSWGAVGLLLLTVTCSLGILFSYLATKTWRLIRAIEPAGDVRLRRRRRAVIITGSVFTVLFVVLSIATGHAIGQSGADEAELESDLSEMQTLGTQISTARDSVSSTVASYVSMYKAVEPNVNRLDIVLHRLVRELAAYDGRFPEQTQETSKTISSVNIGIQRMALVKRQIIVAKRIGDLLSSDEQLRAWDIEMRPLLTEEDALSKGTS